MLVRLLLILGMAFAAASCGVKSDLLTPGGKTTPNNQKDPSRPPQPLGR